MTTLNLAKEWLRYAKSDLNTARHMFNDVHPKEIEISCYHAQQCAEKSLKAYLIAKETDLPYIHDLIELIRLCTAIESSFSTIQPYCVSLNPYGVQVRYPNELAVDDSITGQAINYAEKVLEFCEKTINDLGQNQNG
ncbi:MAG: HEPN domain-containing protein [Treponema sp.]|jgi:HEPN domain-containing protein|nr:HEPN domain-containing protein [Treponema sp.]